MRSKPPDIRIPEPPDPVSQIRDGGVVSPPLSETTRDPNLCSDREAPPANVDGIIVSRSRIRWYYLLLIVTAICFFCLGWLANRGQSVPTKPQNKPAEGTTPVLLAGQIRYGRPNGLPIPDGGAVVIVLPSHTTPERPIPIEGLRPWDSETAAGQVNRQRLAELGAGWVKVAEDGSYNVVLPQPGKYWVLMISRSLARRKATLELANRGIAELDLKQMSQYFERPGDLIGPQAYHWSLETIGPTGLNLNHDFQTPADLGIPELP